MPEAPRPTGPISITAAGTRPLEICRQISLTPPAPGHPVPVPGSLRETIGAGLARLPLVGRDVLLLA